MKLTTQQMASMTRKQQKEGLSLQDRALIFDMCSKLENWHFAQFILEQVAEAEYQPSGKMLAALHRRQKQNAPTSL